VISAAADLARRLARDAEAVCRHYLSKGRRSGRYWIVGDVQNTPGRSLYVRLSGPDYGPGAAGKWTDAATGERGDLLDLIALNRDLHPLGEAMIEARSFLALPRAVLPVNHRQRTPSPTGSSEAARRLFAAARPVRGTPAEAYLRARGISASLHWPALRFHPSVYYRAELTGYAAGAVPQLKALGLISEIIAWRLRLFIPTPENRGPAILAALLERHPLLRVHARAAA